MELAEFVRLEPVRYSGWIVLAVFALATGSALVVMVREGAWIAEGAVAGLVFLGTSFVLQAIVAFLGCAVIWSVGRARVQWSTVDYTAVVVPWAVWSLLIMFGRGEKSFSNMLFEGLVVGCAAPIGALARCLVGNHIPRRHSYVMSVGLPVALAVLLWRITPFLGE